MTGRPVLDLDETERTVRYLRHCDLLPLTLALVAEVRELRAENIELAARLSHAAGERDASQAQVERVRAWAEGDYGGAKRPIDVWPGLRAALAALDTPEPPEAKGEIG